MVELFGRFGNVLFRPLRYVKSPVFRHRVHLDWQLDEVELQAGYGFLASGLRHYTRKTSPWRVLLQAESRFAHPYNHSNMKQNKRCSRISAGEPAGRMPP